MSINESEIIDSVICGKDYEDVVLLITDHLDWEHPQEHMLLLQKKFNTYIKFVESGQLEEDFLEAKNKPIKIMVVGKYELTELASAFFSKAQDFLTANVNVGLLFSIENE